MLAQIDTNMEKSNKILLRGAERPGVVFFTSAYLYLFGPASWFTGCWPGLQDANPLASWVASCFSYKPAQYSVQQQAGTWNALPESIGHLLQSCSHRWPPPAPMNQNSEC